MKQLKKTLLTLVALFAMTTGAWADDYTITLPTVSNGSVVAKVSDVSVTSAAAGATVSLVATPDAGYRLKTIGGTYQEAPQETLSKGAATRTGNYFKLTASNSVSAGWTLYSSSTITIERLDGGNISTVVLNITPRASFAFNEMSVNHGSMTRDGNVITISGINSSSVVISGTSRGGAYGCVVNSATITGTTTEDKALSLTSTGDDNVKTFTMPSGNVTVSAEFEAAAPAGTALKPDATRKLWTLDAMPAGNVELQVAYFPGMLTLPAKTAEGSIEVVGLSGETLPAGFDTDGTNYYVEPKTQFQVKAVPAEGYHLVSLSDGTNSYDVDADGIATVTMPEGDADLTLTATFSDEFDLTFDDVNFKTNKNITVKVADADKTLDQDGKLSVKSGQTVTLTAKQGYKFRSVEAKKAAKAPTTAQLNVPTEWNGDNTKVSANDLPGLVALTDEEAANIACPDAEGYVYVIHSVPSDGYIKIIAFNNGEKQAQQSFTLGRNHGEIYDDVNDIQIKYYYTTGK